MSASDWKVQPTTHSYRVYFKDTIMAGLPNRSEALAAMETLQAKYGMNGERLPKQHKALAQ